MFKHIDTDHKIKGLTTGQFQKVRLMKLDSLFTELFPEIGFIILEVLSFHVYGMNSYILKMVQKKSVVLTKTTSRINQFPGRSEEHTSELQSRGHLVCRLLL